MDKNDGKAVVGTWLDCAQAHNAPEPYGSWHRAQGHALTFGSELRHLCWEQLSEDEARDLCQALEAEKSRWLAEHGRPDLRRSKQDEIR